MYNWAILCKIILNILENILLLKRMETFWSRDVIDIQVLAHFQLEAISILYMLNCFKYF